MAHQEETPQDETTQPPPHQPRNLWTTVISWPEWIAWPWGWTKCAETIKTLRGTNTSL